GLLYYLAGAKARMAAAAREAQVKPEHVQQLKTLDVVAPEVHTDLERIAAETPEPPQAWEVMESAEEEPDQRR
ncbi:MAG TPA: hypothetical protein VGE52_04215, partial [Pirellulales bacterium]